MFSRSFFYYLLCLLMFFASCNNHSKDIDSILAETEGIVDQYPDSAIMMLDTIPYFGSLSKEQTNNYQLLLIQAKDKNYKDIASDTSIFSVKEYFEQKKDIEKSALANFYCARVYESQANLDNAMEAYLRARDYAEKTDDENLKGLILYNMGIFNSKNFLRQDAIDKYKQAVSCFSKLTDGYKNEILAYKSIGNSYLILEKKDSAYFYYKEALDLAKLHRDSAEISNLYQNLGVAYREAGDYDKAKASLETALSFGKNETDIARIYMNLAKVFDSQNLFDSTAYYIPLSLAILEKSEDKQSPLLPNLYLTSSKMEEKKGNFMQALEYYKKYTQAFSTILEKKQNDKFLEVEKKYNYQLIKNVNNQLLIDKQKIFMVCLLLAFSIFIISFFYYRKHNQQKNTLLKERADLLEAEQQILSLKAMADSFNEKENTLRNEVIRHFNILKKVASLSEQGVLNDDNKKVSVKLSKINEIVYGSEDGSDWAAIVNSINILHEGIASRMKETYRQLDDTELKVCYLTYAGFSNSEIAIILKLAHNTIHQKKSTIRKKIGVPEYGNFNEFFTQNLKRI